MNNDSFTIDEKGVWSHPEASGDTIPEPIFVCSPLFIPALSTLKCNK